MNLNKKAIYVLNCLEKMKPILLSLLSREKSILDDAAYSTFTFI